MKPLARLSSNIIRYLGTLIKTARKERKMSQMDLSERAGISSATIQRIEKGNPNVSIGTYIEVCVILNIPIFGGNKESVSNFTQLLGYINPLLPSKVREKNVKVDDDF